MGKRLAAVLAVVLALLPGVAFGVGDGYENFNGNGVFWSGTASDGDMVWAINVRNKYNAAIFALGYKPWEIGYGYREKLSDSNYGGKFYEFAQLFEEATEPPDWLPVYALAQWYLYLSTGAFGSTNDSIYIGKSSKTLYDAALTDLKKVLNGEEVGGSGGGSGASGAYWGDNQIPDTVILQNVGQTFTDSLSLLPGVSTVKWNWTNILSGISSETYPHISLLVVYGIAGNVWRMQIHVIFSENVPTYIYSNNNLTINNMGAYRIRINYNGFNRSKVPSGSSDADALGYNIIQDENATYNTTRSGTNTYLIKAEAQFTPSVMSMPYNSQAFYMYTNDLATPAPPSGDWPENPTPTPTPDPPEVPSPTDPEPEPEPEPDPITADPYTPTLPPLTYPTVTTEPTGTTPADYTPWLRQILAALNSVHTDLATYTNDIVSGLNQVISAINALAQSNINAANKLDASLNTHCEHLRTNLDNNFSALKQYLKQLFEWLEDKLDWDAAGYDDSALLRQLRSIEAKLGGGTYRPNPSDNPAAGSPDFFAWLSDLLGGLITALLGLTPEVLGQLTGAFDGLTDLFPISIPWDIMAMLALFAAEPVTPVFDMPVPVGGALADGSMVMSHVDLTDWDGIAAVVRTLELVLFGFAVAQRVPEWLGLARTGDE